jgi:CDGSH-type Zn-finger protein
MPKYMKEGTRVEWTYEHKLNRNSSTYITKKGTVQEITGKVKNKRYVSGSHAKVLFDGNKNPSCVPVNELKTI